MISAHHANNHMTTPAMVSSATSTLLVHLRHVQMENVCHVPLLLSQARACYVVMRSAQLIVTVLLTHVLMVIARIAMMVQHATTWHAHMIVSVCQTPALMKSAHLAIMK
jgi:hypothetical protein